MLPLPPNHHRSGHPLEAGNHLRQLGIRFLLLHECAHIVLNHFDAAPGQSTELEFEADLCALRLSFQCARSSHAAIASLLGARLILAIARRIEVFDKERSSTSHPPSDERLRKLREFVCKTDLLSDSIRIVALSHFDEEENRDLELAQAAADFRKGLAMLGNTVTRLLKQCIEEKNLNMFMDQVPRWIFQGAPSRLCSSLAAARVQFETKLKTDPNNDEGKLCLEAIMQIYNTASSNSNPALRSKLEAAYVAVASSVATQETRQVLRDAT